MSTSSAEAEYRAMCAATKELLWVSYVLTDLHIPYSLPVHLYCDNTTALHIASNPVFHERTKFLEIDCHKVREKMDDGFFEDYVCENREPACRCTYKGVVPCSISGKHAQEGSYKHFFTFILRGAIRLYGLVWFSLVYLYLVINFWSTL